MLNRSLIFSQIRFKSIKKQIDYSRVPKLNEDDLEERHVRGSGPGGQSVSKTSNAVVLKHKPTGIVVKSHKCRSLFQNQKTAREILITKIDNEINGELSVENQEKSLQKKQSAEQQKKRNKMLELKNAFKKREGID